MSSLSLAHLSMQTWLLLPRAGHVMEHAAMRELANRQDLASPVLTDEVSQAMLRSQRQNHKLTGGVLASSHAGGGARYDVVGSTAVIQVSGVLMKELQPVYRLYGFGTSYHDVSAAIDAASTDPSVRAIVLMFDSPGGSADGLESLALKIFNRREQKGKKIYAYAYGLCCSAAVWLASQTSLVVASPVTFYGSIGTYRMLYDTTEWYKQMGVRAVMVRKGEHKAIGMDGVAVTPEQEAEISREADAVYEKFKDVMVRGRPQLKASIDKLASGQVWGEEEAKKLGLIDSVKTFEDFIGWVNNKHGGGGSKVLSSQSEMNVSIGGVRVVRDEVDAVDASSQSRAEGTESMRTGLMFAAALALTLDPNSETGGGGSAVKEATKPPEQTLTMSQFKTAMREVVKEVVLEETKPLRDNVAHTSELQRQQAIRDRAALFGENAQVKTAMEKAIADPSVTPQGFADQCLVSLKAPSGMTSQANDTAIQLSVGVDAIDKRARATALVLHMQESPSVLADLAGKYGDAIAVRAGFASGAEALKVYREAAVSGLRGKRVNDLALGLVKAEHRAKVAAMDFDSHARFSYMASQGSSDFPIAMSNLANLMLAQSFEGQETSWQEIAGVENLKDFKPATKVTMSTFGNFAVVPENQRPKFETKSERGITISVETFGLAFGWSYKAMVNDSLGTFADDVRNVGESARLLPEQLVTERLVGNSNWIDGQPFFGSHTIGNRTFTNVLGPSALSYATAREADVAFGEMRDFNGRADRPIKVMGDRLYVPQALKHTAMEIYLNTKDTSRGTGDSPVNTVAGMFRPIVNPWLRTFVGGTATRHFYFCDPRRQPAVLVGFLNGRQAPTIEMSPTSDQFGTSFTAMLSLGTAWGHPEFALMNNGA